MQDVTMVHMSPYQAGGQGLGYNLAVFAVADGHNGSAAALHCQESLFKELMRHMPSTPPPIAPGTQGTRLLLPVAFDSSSTAANCAASYTDIMCMLCSNQGLCREAARSCDNNISYTGGSVCPERTTVR